MTWQAHGTTTWWDELLDDMDRATDEFWDSSETPREHLDARMWHTWGVTDLEKLLCDRVEVRLLPGSVVVTIGLVDDEPALAVVELRPGVFDRRLIAAARGLGELHVATRIGTLTTVHRGTLDPDMAIGRGDHARELLLAATPGQAAFAMLALPELRGRADLATIAQTGTTDPVALLQLARTDECAARIVDRADQAAAWRALDAVERADTITFDPDALDSEDLASSMLRWIASL